jgi:hypothetical protein
MFRRPNKEKKEVVEVIHKCSFCKKQNSVSNIGKIYYCANNDCAIKLHERKLTVDDELVVKKPKKAKSKELK